MSHDEELSDQDDDVPVYVKLVSAEGYEFFLDRELARAASTTMRTMLKSKTFLEARENTIRLPDMAGYIMERLVKYIHYKAKYSNSTSRIPEFVRSLISLSTDSNRRQSAVHYC